jgi:hypothetical protein
MTVDVGYPDPDRYTLSYWLARSRTSPLLGHRTTEELPLLSDVVIIGSS